MPSEPGRSVSWSSSLRRIQYSWNQPTCPNSRQAQTVDGWQKTFAFLEKHLGAPAKPA
jgi:hypothetical protein